MNEWEEYNIKIGYADDDEEHPQQFSDITDRFESELFRLIKKYNGQAGLKFEARNSLDQPIMEY